MSFDKYKRQQFLTEEYYLKTTEYNEEGIPLYLESDAFEDDQYNCGEASRWESITWIYQSLLYLHYTAGKPIEEISPLFEKVIEGYEKQAEALGVFKASKKPVVIGGEGGFIALTTISLAVLLNKNNLLSTIKQLINGEDGGTFSEDEVINKFLKLTDSNHPDTERDGIYSYNFSILCDVIDNVIIKNNKNHAIELLDEYLADWYQMHKNTLWYNSHLNLDNYSYVGYWAFEAAALVYLLDLDESSLHKHLFYPKDIVAWARKNNTQSEVTQENLTVIKVKAGEKSPKTGYWTTPAQEDSRVHVLRGEMLPTLSETDWGEVYWYFNGEE
ncbi:PoNe immunity protein domain-containing protein [Acinetobacter amyesii]|uniref:PoNe immunity protein domain-containing protein n=1 Tax=Acinetobacter amyesii TaxID=2942470 RepID=UPI0020C0B414|nr:PoNe immunity protein domain-containing protein [Acinetobacter amyesii]MCL6233525.1 PoNi-like cognate immunity protein [Acinetobacter amyesii]